MICKGAFQICTSELVKRANPGGLGPTRVAARIRVCIGKPLKLPNRGGSGRARACSGGLLTTARNAPRAVASRLKIIYYPELTGPKKEMWSIKIFKNTCRFRDDRASIIRFNILESHKIFFIKQSYQPVNCLI